MKSSLTTLKPSDSILGAIQIFSSAKVRHAPVLDSGKLVGIITEWDLLRAVARDKVESLAVSDVMTGNAHTTTPKQSTQALAMRLAEERISCLPVVENERVVGLVTITDVLEAAAREHGANARPKKKATAKPRVNRRA